MRFVLALAPIALALAATGCGSDHGGGSPPPPSGRADAASTTVGTRATELGTVLVDGRGRTLYLFEKDKGATSACTGACASVWPPLTAAGKLATSGAAMASDLAPSPRRDGKTAVTYAGHPLYTYAGDTQPGDVTGQGLDQFGGGWYALTPDGRKIDDD